MLTPNHHAVRARGLGSSDAAVACGLSPWKSKVQLWLEKTRRVEPEDISDIERVHFGNVLEDVVAKEFERRNSARVQKKTVPYLRTFDGVNIPVTINTDGSWKYDLPTDQGAMVANVDRLIVNENAILECKTADAFTQGKWEEVPIHYQLQVHHQMVASQKFNAKLAVLIGGNQYRDFEIEADPVVHQELVRREAEFFQHVINDTPPDPTTSEEVILLWDSTPGKAITATPELMELHTELMATRIRHKELEARKKELEEIFKMYLGKAEILMGTGATPIATWKQAKGTPYTKWETVAKEVGAKIPDDEFQSIILAHSGTIPGSRRFLPKEIKDND